MKPPRPKSHFPDRTLDCECELEAHIETLLEEGTTIGWLREEMLEALMQVTQAMQLAEAANDLVEETIGCARHSWRH